MTVNGFWRQIDYALETAIWGAEGQVVSSRLSEFGAREASEWRDTFNMYLTASRPSLAFRKAALLVNGYDTEIAYDRFRGWTMLQGKKVFLGAMQDPESLASLDLDINIAVNNDILTLAEKSINFSLCFARWGIAERERLKREVRRTDLPPIVKELVDADVCPLLPAEESNETLVYEEVEKEYPLLAARVKECIKAGRHGPLKQVVDFWLSQIPAERLVLLDQYEQEGNYNLIAKLTSIVPPQERTFAILHYLNRALCKTGRNMQAFEIITAIQDKTAIENSYAYKDQLAREKKQKP
jgi:hypothetical protein